MKRRAAVWILIKAVLQGCPLTDSPVNLPFNWRGHKRRGATSITNVLCLEQPGMDCVCVYVC